MRILYTLFLMYFISAPIFAQIDIVERSITMGPTNEAITIDGVADEQSWSSAGEVSGFWLQSPIDGVEAKDQAKVKMLYDDQNIYVFAELEDHDPHIVLSRERDNVDGSDAFYVTIDPVGTKTNGFLFAVSSEGVQFEALIFGNDADDSWDNKWFSATTVSANQWTVEIAIPLKTLRYEEGENDWRINFGKDDPGENEIHVWNPVPRQFEPFDLGYFGKLIWEKPPVRKGSNIALIPYTAVRMNQVANGSTSSEIAFGGDAKVALGPSLNLDLTVNPDFSQVEVDDQITNLTRFNIFFPEKRQFFIENADVFSAFGQGIDQPFYTRRIGLDSRGNTVPITYGARLTGNVNEKLRIGVLNMHSQTTDASLGQNYSAVALHQRIGARSLVKGLLLNRQSFDGAESISDGYSRNIALETELSTKDGRWQATGGYLQSFTPNSSGDDQMVHGGLFYNGQRFRAFIQGRKLGQNYTTDSGFTSRLENFNPITGTVERIGYGQIGSMLNYYIYPENSEKVNFHWSGIENFVWTTDGYGLTEWYTRIRHFIFYKNTSQLRFRLNNRYVELIFPFALTETPLPVDTYNMTEFNVDIRGDQRNLFIPNLFVVYGEFFNGNKLTILSSVNYRIQPWANFSFGLEYNDINLPEPYGDLDITALTGQIQFNFTNSLFWTNYLQYNTQADNFNINSRLQWRFAPMSDLFFVYTDNYAIENFFGPKNRSIVLKLNYWLSL